VILRSPASPVISICTPEPLTCRPRYESKTNHHPQEFHASTVRLAMSSGSFSCLLNGDPPLKLMAVSAEKLDGFPH